LDGENLQERAAARTQDLPGAELTHPFGDDWDVYKVRGKVFMLQTAVLGQPIVILKATPSDGLALRTAYEGHHFGLPHVQKALDHSAPGWRPRPAEEPAALYVDGGVLEFVLESQRCVKKRPMPPPAQKLPLK
jgi:hypothetical protein